MLACEIHLPESAGEHDEVDASPMLRGLTCDHLAKHGKRLRRVVPIEQPQLTREQIVVVLASSASPLAIPEHDVMTVESGRTLHEPTPGVFVATLEGNLFEQLERVRDGLCVLPAECASTLSSSRFRRALPRANQARGSSAATSVTRFAADHARSPRSPRDAIAASTSGESATNAESD